MLVLNALLNIVTYVSNKTIQSNAFNVLILIYPLMNHAFVRMVLYQIVKENVDNVTFNIAFHAVIMNNAIFVKSLMSIWMELNVHALSVTFKIKELVRNAKLLAASNVMMLQLASNAYILLLLIMTILFALVL